MPAAPQALRKVDRTRVRLVDAAREELEAVGSLNAERIARQAGSSPATFYNHFSSKDEALVAVFSAAMDDLVAVVREQLRVERLLEVGLEAFAESWVGACLEFFRANNTVFSAARVQSKALKAFRDVYREHESTAFEDFRRFVELGQKAQVVRAGDAAAIAQALLVAAQGWNNPLVLRSASGAPLQRELSRSVVHLLAPEETQ